MSTASAFGSERRFLLRSGRRCKLIRTATKLAPFLSTTEKKVKEKADEIKQFQVWVDKNECVLNEILEPTNRAQERLLEDFPSLAGRVLRHTEEGGPTEELTDWKNAPSSDFSKVLEEVDVPCDHQGEVIS